MTRIVTPTLGTSEWRAGLADTQLHWKRGRSAWELAVAWEAQRDSESGIPGEVVNALDSHPDFGNAKLLLGIVEHRVRLDTTKTPSQNDLWAIILTDGGHVSVAVEAKAGEEFDRPISEWLGDNKEAKSRRLSFLCQELGVTAPPPTHLRYQLFHRAASATLEARRWRLAKALMLIQSFGESATAWNDYAQFASWLGILAARNGVVGPHTTNGVALYVGWIDSPKASDRAAATAI